MKRLISLLLALSMVLGMSLAFAEEEHQLTIIPGDVKTKVKLAKNYPDNKCEEGIAPLTGLPSSGEKYTPILMTLDNAEAAYPHWGVSDGDVFFQVPNAGAGATKLMVLFADKYPEDAGGTRSARGTMVPVAAAFGSAFAYAGYPPLEVQDNSSPKYLMPKLGITIKNNLSYNLLGNKYNERVKWTVNPHNLSCKVREIHENMVANKVDIAPRPYKFAAEPRTVGADAKYVHLDFYGDSKKKNPNPASECSFTYSDEDKGYIRTNSVGDYEDRLTGETLVFANVIVLREKITWRGGYPCYGTNLTGSGTAEIFQNGKYVQGAWYREKEKSRLVFIDADGKELEMQPGKTFIVMGTADTDVGYSAN